MTTITKPLLLNIVNSSTNNKPLSLNIVNSSTNNKPLSLNIVNNSSSVNNKPLSLNIVNNRSLNNVGVGGGGVVVSDHSCYILMSSVSNRVYIGYTVKFSRRIRQH